MKIFSMFVAFFFAAGLAGETPAASRPRILYIDAAELQRAVDEAPPHSVLMADRGQQVEVSATIRIEKPLTLVGLNARLKPGLEKTPMIEVLSEGVAIRDFTLEGNVDSVPFKQRASLIVLRRGRFIIENGETNNSAKDGVMVTPTSEYGDIEHGVIRNVTGIGTARDVISIGGQGDKGLFIRHLVVENIRAYGSAERGAIEVSDGSEYVTVRDIYAESSHYAVDVQDHRRQGMINRHIIIDGVNVKDCEVAVRTANADFSHDGLTIRNVSGVGFRQDDRWSPLHVKNTRNVLIENVRIHYAAGVQDSKLPSVLVQNSDNVTIRNLTVVNAANDGAAVLVEDANNALLDNVVFEGDKARPRHGILYRVRANEQYRGLRIHNVLAQDVRSEGIVLENVSESGSLDSYMITGNLSSVRDEVKGHRAVVRDNLPGAVE